MNASRLETFFVRFRTSWGFVLTVTAFIAGWIIWHLIPGLPHFDDPIHFGHLNLILSVEATIATVMLMRDNERSRLRDNESRVREITIISELSESLARLSRIEQDIDEIQEGIDEVVV
jgi:uncharacterized membrane protein